MHDPLSPPRLVPCAERHVPGVIALVRSCYAEYGQWIELETLDADLSRLPASYPPPNTAFQVLLDRDAVIGSVAVRHTAAQQAQLKRVFLLAPWRGRGLGKQLVTWACHWARGRGCRRLVFWSDALYEKAHAFYEHLGARRTGRSRQLGGVNDVREHEFELELPPPT